MEIEILNFIDRFTHRDFYGNIKECFSHESSYWFARLLNIRFPKSFIMYDELYHHFMILLNNELYDINGKVTSQYRAVQWNSYTDKKEKEKIIRESIIYQEYIEEDLNL